MVEKKKNGVFFNIISVVLAVVLLILYVTDQTCHAWLYFGVFFIIITEIINQEHDDLDLLINLSLLISIVGRFILESCIHADQTILDLANYAYGLFAILGFAYVYRKNSINKITQQ